MEPNPNKNKRTPKTKPNQILNNKQAQIELARIEKMMQTVYVRMVLLESQLSFESKSK